MSMLSCAELLVKCLENEGVRYIFGVPGEEIIEILDNVRSSEIKFVVTRHEQGAAFMANAFGRLTGHPGVCISTLGPGATNLATGVADALLGHSPLVAITGQAELDRLFKASSQHIDLRQLYEPITKWNAMLYKETIVPEVVRKAFKVALTEKFGPTNIVVPQDVARHAMHGKPFSKYETEEPYANREAIQRAAEYINAAMAPLILAGGGVVRERASNELRIFAERANIPVVNTREAIGVFPHSSPLSLYTAGLPFNDMINCAFEYSDLVIALGFDIEEYPPSSWNSKGERRIVHVDSTEAEIDLHYDPVVEVVGELKEAIMQLTGSMRERKHWDYAREVRNRLMHDINEARRANGAHGKIKPQRAIMELRDVMEKDDILVSDVGAHMFWVGKYFLSDVPQAVLSPGGFGAMGFGLPAGIAAKLVHPQKNVVVVAGDGAFIMSDPDFETAVREKLAITFVILDDRKYGLIGMEQQLLARKEFGVSFTNPDFVKYAEAHGVKGIKVKDDSELNSAFKEALGEKMPTIVDVRIDYEENLRLMEKMVREKCPTPYEI